LSGSKSVSTGSRTVLISIYNITNVTSPSADVQVTILRRYR
jgi:hypothetical protein